VYLRPAPGWRYLLTVPDSWKGRAMTITPEQIARLRQLDAQATLGWKVFHGEHGRTRHYIDVLDCMDEPICEMDHEPIADVHAELITASRNALPELLKAAELLERIRRHVEVRTTLLNGITPAADNETLPHQLRGHKNELGFVLALLADQQEGQS
jgi:hypothetical protein